VGPYPLMASPLVSSVKYAGRQISFAVFPNKSIYKAGYCLALKKYVKAAVAFTPSPLRVIGE